MKSDSLKHLAACTNVNKCYMTAKNTLALLSSFEAYLRFIGHCQNPSGKCDA